jgi:hypothetical protein
LIDKYFKWFIEIFAAKGYEDATIVDISKAAELAEEYSIITFQIRKT